MALLLLIGVYAPAQAQSPVVALSPAAAQVLRLAQAGTSEQVLLAYVQNAPAAYNLSPDNILYLKDVGLPASVVAAMLNHDGAAREQQRLFPTNPPGPPPPIPTPAPGPPSMNSDTNTAPDYVTNAPEDVNWFYSELAPYGTWASVEGVGWCWQPRIVQMAPHWRPYCDGGHWLWTDAGWFWKSDYSWGWAAFHYGRWALNSRCGWVWVPDRTWGPAWLVWRASEQYCGWAPLPPTSVFAANSGWRFQGASVGPDFDFGLHPSEFTCVALGDFLRRDLSEHQLPEPEAAAVLGHTAVVKNYASYGAVIVNRGVPVERIEAATHLTVAKIEIRDQPALTTERSRTETDTAGAILYRHPLSPPSSQPGILAQKVDARHPTIVHGLLAPPHVAPRSHATAPTQSSGSRETPK